MWKQMPVLAPPDVELQKYSYYFGVAVNRGTNGSRNSFSLPVFWEQI